MRNADIATNQNSCLREKFGVDIKGRAESVFIQNFNQASVLQDTVIITEGNGLSFSVPHII
jgi:hypothetical protein